ncbi:MAG: recombination protein RecR [Bdellovibrionaceae bacterium]|nr:recombination protein RecR [Pseudobdellovibrionaceae bacterium]|tara:strand:+ start:23333 stop:23932 length:600 start_codon:yes stop_codon:yes gene_type:complete
MSHLASLDQLILELSKLPGIGEKSAGRLAHYILKNRSQYPSDLAKALLQVQEKVQLCESCFAYSESPVCRICSDEKRNKVSLCVVEEPSDIMKLENSGSFYGRYHVLHGTINPMRGIGPADLKVSELIKKVNDDDAIEEVILALDANLEGDTTALYIAKMLEGHRIRLTRLAHGIPIGGDLDYIDGRTIGRAFVNRVEI